jgi:membrane protein YdbS with pleckstrin-like domain
VSRWLNVAAAVLTLLYVLGGGNWESSSYFVFALLEVVAMLGIIWQAWTWRNDEA